jgi:hypothetical protein
VSEILRYRYDRSGGQLAHGPPAADVAGNAAGKLDDARNLMALPGRPQRKVIKHRLNRCARRSLQCGDPATLERRTEADGVNRFSLYV